MDNFNIDKYLYANDDIFQQLDNNMHFNDKSRRFSLSIDGSFNTEYDEEIEFLTSDILSVTPNTFEVPKIDSCIYYDPGTDNILYSSPNYNLVEEILIQGIPKSQLIINSKMDISFYKIPINRRSDPYRIWNEAGIPELETLYRIETSLLDWANKFAELKISDGKITKIKWKSNSGYEVNSSWPAFIKWILCASL